MGLSRSGRFGKLRFLYLLALAQLVGGPLVLLHVTVLCQLTLREAPRAGVVDALVSAWQSDDFQASLARTDLSLPQNGKKIPPKDGPEIKPDKAKQPLIPWSISPLRVMALIPRADLIDRPRVWTPAWPQAPPGPPPRWG